MYRMYVCMSGQGRSIRTHIQYSMPDMQNKLDLLWSYRVGVGVIGQGMGKRSNVYWIIGDWWDDDV